MSQPLVVITGASSGIGLATARAFAAVNYPLLLISRNIEPIAELSDKPVDYASRGRDRLRRPAARYSRDRTKVREYRLTEGKNGVRVINTAPGYVKTNIHQNMSITFEQYSHVLGNPDFMTADELADIILYCYRLPAHLSIRELVVAPTRTAF